MQGLGGAEGRKLAIAGERSSELGFTPIGSSFYHWHCPLNLFALVQGKRMNHCAYRAMLHYPFPETCLVLSLTANKSTQAFTPSEICFGGRKKNKNKNKTCRKCPTHCMPHPDFFTFQHAAFCKSSGRSTIAKDCPESIQKKLFTDRAAPRTGKTFTQA